MIVVIDARLGNIGSIVNMLKRVGAAATASADAAVIAAADHLILPGVGAFDQGMGRLADLGLVAVLERQVLERKVPLLGICLGMQLLTRRSEEGQRPGLGWIAADTVRFHFDPKATGLKIPHMGWNAVEPARPDGIFTGHDPEGGFYFVHSYHVVCDRPEDVLGWTRHGYPFASAVGSGNIVGTQFHPEKSHRHGMRLLTNFVAMGSGCCVPA